MFDTIECDSPVHGSAVNVYITDFFGKVFRHGTFATGRKPVDCDNDFVHTFNI